VLLSRVAVPDNGLKTLAVRQQQINENSLAHAPDSHTPPDTGIPKRTLSSDFIH
jgi:hypothetical protein